MTRRTVAGILFSGILLFSVALPLRGQSFRLDTLHLDVFFRQGDISVDPDFRNNGSSLETFRDSLDKHLRDTTAFVRVINIRSSASPEGNTRNNQRLSEGRGQAIKDWLVGRLNVEPNVFHIEAVGEDWEGLADRVRTLDVPWRDDALDIIRNTPSWIVRGGAVVDSRKNRLRRLADGEAWAYLNERVFPDLRSGGSSVACIVYKPIREVIREVDTVYVDRRSLDTVYVETPVFVEPEPVQDDRRMLFALRTNVLAVPFANIGIEVPLGEHWSIGADYYYPWFWRKNHAEGVDYTGRCFEFLALDLEARYWFTNTRRSPAQRLLGHSLGLYAATGYYDIERDWTGYQGEFWNAGVDYLFACPIFGGRMHLEFELGVGIIEAISQPYDCFVQGDRCFRRAGVKQKTQWIGPSRAQISLVVPIYIHKKGGAQ